MSAKLALGLVVLGVVLILHALSRVDHGTFDNGRFILIVIELLAGAFCLVGPLVAVGVGILLS